MSYNIIGLLAIAAISGAIALGALEEPRAVAFPTTDGHTLSGDFYQPGGDEPVPCVILLHDYKQDRSSWRPLALALAKAGIAALAVDLRGHGESATPETRERLRDRDPVLVEQTRLDLHGAYDWLAVQQRIDRARLALVGCGFGGALALHYAAADRSIDTVVCLDPPVEFMGIDCRSDIAKIKGRALLALVSADAVSRAAAQTLSDSQSRLKISKITGAARGVALLGSGDALSRVVAHLRRELGSPSREVVFGSINSHIYHPPESGWIAQIAPTNLRHYSSAREAEARGLRKTRSLRVERERGDAERAVDKP